MFNMKEANFEKRLDGSTVLKSGLSLSYLIVLLLGVIMH